MTQYILINRINVQNANAIAGFTWGFPGITNFMGFAHNLARNLSKSNFDSFSLFGCGVIAHEHHIHTYGDWSDKFLQNKTPPYLHSHDKAAAPPVIEEGKMNMTVSLLIGFEGFPGNQADSFIAWLKKQCLLQRLAGGTILDIDSVQIFDVTDKNRFYLLKRKLLPGFVLMDRSDELAQHHEKNLTINPDSELLDAWLDFSALKQKARPKYNLISKYLNTQVKQKLLDKQVLSDWASHLAKIPYEPVAPSTVTACFSGLDRNESTKAVLEQWEHYVKPTDKSPADWEYLPKPSPGYLVPITTGYKAISSVYANEEVANTRDSETPVCFVEATHSIGEWYGVNNFRSADDIASCLWYYEHEEHWYLCKQSNPKNQIDTTDETNDTFITKTLDLS